MSGICGIIHTGGSPIDPMLPQRMILAMAHRGPDGQNLALADSAAFGHCLLATEDGGPPMGRLLEEEDLLATADCRLDNREALTEALGIAPDTGDTGILLAGYRRWGEALASHLLGDFAFTIWDKPARRLYAARDHFGIKPYYYACAPAFFVFATEPSAIFASGLVERHIRETGIADFLAGVAPGVESTGYTGVRRLPPGHFCVAAGNDLRLTSYWSLPVPRIMPRQDAPGEFRQLLGQAVAARLRGGRTGVMLSGGLNSSAIACLAASQTRGGDEAKLPTFSMVFDATPELNERQYIEKVLAQGGFSPTFIASDDVPPFAALDIILKEQQDLFLAPNMACSRRLAHTAHGAGVRVLLDGHGGDEVAPVGAGRLHELAADGRWLTLWHQLGDGVLPPGEKKLPSYFAFLKHYSLLRKIRRISRGLRHASPPAGDPSLGFIDADFAARTGVAERMRAQRAAPHRGAAMEQQFHYNLLNSPLQSHAFEILDRTAAAAGVEPRYPFWDKRLVEFCLSLTPAEKLNHGWGRLILRRALDGILPRDVQWRRGKLNFMPHLAAAMIRNHAGMLADLLADGGGVLGAYVNLPNLRAALERLRGNPAQPNGYEVQCLWRTMILAFWLKQNAGGDAGWQI